MSLESKLQLIRSKSPKQFEKPVVEATYRKSDQMIPLLPGKLKLNLQDDFDLKQFSPECRQHTERNKQGSVLNTTSIDLKWSIIYDLKFSHIPRLILTEALEFKTRYSTHWHSP